MFLFLYSETFIFLWGKLGVNIMADYFSGSLNDFFYNPYLTLNRRIYKPKTPTYDSIHVSTTNEDKTEEVCDFVHDPTKTPEEKKKAREAYIQERKATEAEQQAQGVAEQAKKRNSIFDEAKKHAPVSDTFSFHDSKNRNVDEYRANALAAARAYIADGDVKDASGKGDGKLTREEYIAMQKAKTQKLDAQTGSVMEGAQWDDEIHPKIHGSVFDAINSQKSTDGTPETIDEKEVAAYLSFVDAHDDKMDGKIQFGKAHGMEETLADKDNPKSAEKTSQLKDWYGNLF